MHAVLDPLAASAHQIRLGRVKITAGRVAAQRPAGVIVLFPGGEAEGELKQGGDAVQRQRLRCDLLWRV